MTQIVVKTTPNCGLWERSINTKQLRLIDLCCLARDCSFMFLFELQAISVNPQNIFFIFPSMAGEWRLRHASHRTLGSVREILVRKLCFQMRTDAYSLPQAPILQRTIPNQLVRQQLQHLRLPPHNLLTQDCNCRHTGLHLRIESLDLSNSAQ